MRYLEPPDAFDVALVELTWLSLLSPGIGYVIWMELVRFREERRLDRLEAEAMAAEGYPPPDPPTTDQPPAVKR